MENTIPTAEEFLPKNDNGKYSRNEVEKAMIEFTKLHVQAALKEVQNRIYMNNEINDMFLANKESILNAYPLTNIK